MASTREINGPKHYRRGTIEPWDFIRDQRLNYHLGCAVKYIARAGYKDNKIDDLKKAIHYLENEIENSITTGQRIQECLQLNGYLGMQGTSESFDR